MGTMVVTGSASGIGAATRARLEADGHEVIGVDLRNAEVVADLGTAEGRAALVEQVEARAPDGLDGVVAAAGVVGAADNAELVVRVNAFGAMATLAGLRPLLARRPGSSAVALSSNSTTTQPGLPVELVDACGTGDEAVALEVASRLDGVSAYAATKLALARWVRRQAVAAEWIGAGIRLNAVAPGFIATPMTAGTEDFILGLGDVYPIPAARAGTADEVAALLAFLLGPDAGFFCGSFLVMDGGTDAALRADDWPSPRP